MNLIRDSYTPVVALEIKTRGRFKSVGEAANELGLNHSGIREAATTGQRFGGYWWRYLDMPANCQPLKSAKNVQVVREDGQHFDGITAVMLHHHPELASVEKGDPKRHREHMRATRAIQRGKPYEGKTYQRIFGLKPGTAVPEARRSA